MTERKTEAGVATRERERDVAVSGSHQLSDLRVQCGELVDAWLALGENDRLRVLRNMLTLAISQSDWQTHCDQLVRAWLSLNECNRSQTLRELLAIAGPSRTAKVPDNAMPPHGRVKVRRRKAK
jgi:hypothetical protein